MAVLYGRVWRLTARNGGFRPGQFREVGKHDPARRGDGALSAPGLRAGLEEALAVALGLGRIVALHRRPSTLYRNR
jgi:hypothetical protein